MNKIRICRSGKEKIGRFVYGLSLVLLVLITLTQVCFAQNVYNYNGHSYMLTNDWGTWTEAEQEAISLGGHLVTINDAAENAWLTETFKDSYGRDYYGQPWQNGAWIGYYSDGGVWKWISGEPVTYTTYAQNWPIGGTHAYLILAYHPWAGTWDENPWHDTESNRAPNFKGIVEISEGANKPVILQPAPGPNDGTDNGGANDGKDAGFTEPQPWGRNDGNSPVIVLLNSPCNIGLYQGFIQFDLNGMPTNTNKAEVQMYTRVLFNGAGWPWQVSPIISLHKVTQPWNEMTVAQNSYPSYDSTALSSHTVNTIGGGGWGSPYTEFEGWLTFDITDAYNAWASGSTPNDGLSFVVDNSYCANGDLIYMYTSDYTTDASLRPKLIVNAEETPTEDTTPPSITAPADITAEATGMTTTTVAIGTALATDAGGIASITNDAPATFNLGETIVTWIATDNAGNTASTVQKINVVDTTAPSITAIDSMSVLIGDSSSVLPLPTVSDAVDASPIVTNNAPATFPVGYTDVTWTATDSSGNSATAITIVHATYGYSLDGFLAALNKDSYKAGSVIPVKFGITDSSGNQISTAVVQIWVDKNPGVSSGSSNTENYFRYTDNQYMFNLNTKEMSVGTHVIRVTLGDGTEAQTTIVLK